jgi:hypothetical protein
VRCSLTTNGCLSSGHRWGVFLMKMYRGLSNNLDDMIAMWPLIGFTDAHELVDAFMMAYPHAPQDEHLAQFVIDIARHAGYDIARP